MPADPVLRRLVPGELAAFHAALELAFHDVPAPAEVHERWSRLLELDRTAVAFDGDTIVGTSGAFSQRLSIPGGELPCAGVSVVTVRPTHRRRGVLTRMLGRLHDDARERGEPIAGLTASEGGIYGRFGYGVATWAVPYEIDGAAVPREPDAHDVGAAAPPVELRDPAGAVELLAPVWERLHAIRPGVPSRTAAWWGDVLDDPPDVRDGALPKRLALVRDDDDDAVAGYALYRARPAQGDDKATLEVLELIAPDPEDEARLWRYLSGIDLVGRIDAPLRPVDDPLPLRFDDVRAARPGTQEDVLWLRLLDVPAALSARSWATPVDLAIAVHDPLLPANARTWRLEAGAAGDGRCTATDRAPDLVLDVRELGAAYLGGTQLTRLADAGLVRERTPGSLLALDAALRVPRAPWTPEKF